MKKLLITSAFIFLPLAAQASIARVSERSGGTFTTSQSAITTGSFSATAGNLIAVCIRKGADVNTISSVTDTAGNTYTLAASDTSTTVDPQMYIYYAKNIIGHPNDAITVTFSTSLTFTWAEAIQYSGINRTSPVDAASNKEQGSGSTDLTSNSITTSQASEVLIMCGSQNNIATYTAGTDFTAVNGSVSAEGQPFGGAEEYITSGTLSSYTAHMTSSVTNQATLAWTSFKAATPAWYDTNYSYCRVMTMTAGGGSGGAATTTTIGFPLVATSTISSLEATSSGGNIQLYNYASSTPRDVLVASGSSCTAAVSQLPFYFEKYSSTTGAFTLWIKADDVSSSVAKTVLLYYGNSAATEKSAKSSVWNTDYIKAKYDMSEDPSGSAPQIQDATANSFSGTTEGSMTSSERIAGQVGDQTSFDGTNDDVSIAGTALGATSLTISAWVNSPSFTEDTFGNNSDKGTIVFSTREADADYSPTLFSTPQGGGGQKLAFGCDSSGVFVGAKGATTVSTNTRYHFVGRFAYDVSSGTFRGLWDVYLNGVKDNGSSNNFSLASVCPASGFTSSVWRLANTNQWAGFSNAQIDDLRLYTTALDPNDITTIYNNTVNSAAFWSFGSEQAQFANNPVHGFLKIVRHGIKVTRKMLKIW